MPPVLAKAQTDQPEGPIYIVQKGDTLWDIAQRFGVAVEVLGRENGIFDPSQIKAGDSLIIPGLQGVQGILVTQSVPFGENLRSLSRRYHVPQETLVRLNHLASPGELYSGANLVVPENNAAAAPSMRVNLAAGQSLLELAVIQGVNPWLLVQANDLEGTVDVLPGDVLRLPQADAQDGPGALPGWIKSVEMTPSPLVQGDTGLIRVESDAEQVSLSGSLFKRDLHFFKDEVGDFVALQGVYAMAEPGLYPLILNGELADGTPFGFSQMVPVQAGDFKYYELTVPPETIDPANTKPEDEIWTALAQPITPEKLWEGVFQSPVAIPSPCGYTSFFGERRSYNGSPYNYFHTGLDFCYNYNNEVNEIYAPADGVVVFAGPMTVRGKATMIDHGMGVYTSYMHQKEILVKTGDRVKAGQVIGEVGGSGRVSGPHLHFEVWVGGIQVDPLDWLEKAFP